LYPVHRAFDLLSIKCTYMQFQISFNMKSLLKGLFLLIFLTSFTSFGQTGTGTGTLLDPIIVNSFPHTEPNFNSSGGYSASGMIGACPAIPCCSVMVYKVTLPTNGVLWMEISNFVPLAGSIIAYKPLISNPATFADLQFISATPGNFCGFRDSLQLGRAYYDWGNTPFGQTPVINTGLTNVFDFNNPSPSVGFFPAGDYYILAFNENQQSTIGIGNSSDLTFEFAEACSKLTTPSVLPFASVEFNSASDTIDFYVKNDRQLPVIIDTSNVSITGTDASLFSILTYPDTNLANGDSTLVQVVFYPTSGGAKTASLDIPFSDTVCSTSNVISLTGSGAESEIKLLGNLTSITYNDLTPSVSNFTDMGSIVTHTGSIIKEYFITNTGADTLEITGTVTLTGNAQFVVINQPASTVLPGDTTSFKIEFTPTADGLAFTDVSIVNNDAAQTPFTFRVQATGTERNGLHFDGSNDYVTINDVATSMDGVTTWSIESWIKADPSQTGNDHIISANTTGTGTKFLFRIDDGKLDFYDGATGFEVGPDLRDDTWHHVAVTYDNGTLNMYIDGVKYGTFAAGTISFANNNRWSLGQEYDGSSKSEFFKGALNDVRIWNTVKTDQELADNKYCEISSPETVSDLVAYYTFNQGISNGTNTTITSLIDASSNAYHGVLTSFAKTGTTSNFVPATNVGVNCNSVSVAICDNNSYSVGSNTYTTSGLYIDTLNSTLGQDSIIYTDLALNYGAYAQTVISDTTLCPTDVLTGDTLKTSLVSTLHFEKSNSDWVELDEIADSLINTNRSVFLWMRAAGQVSGTQQVLVGINTSGTGTVTNFGIATNEQIWINDGGSNRNSGITVTDGNWHHVGYTYDEASNLTTFYVDGVAGASFNNGQSISATSRVSFGQEFDGSTTSNFFDGDMTEVSIWNEVLDLTDISKIMSNAISNTHPKYGNLISYHTGNALCSDNIHELKDQGGNNLHGVTSRTTIINKDSLVTITGFNASEHFSTSLTHNGSTLSSTNPYSFTYATPGSYVASLNRDFFNISDTFNITNGVTCSGVTASSTNNSNVSCNGFADGGATASAIGGTTPYTYAWSNTATTASITGVVAGTYSVTITDGAGATDSSSVTITEPSVLVAASVIDANSTCNGSADGGATASATGGTAPYTYSWSNSATTASITGVVAGTYTTTITDANGCTSTSSATVTQPITIIASAAVSDQLDCNGNIDGQVTASSTGGTTPFTYSWNTGGTAALETNLGAGTYSVTVTDQNGCTDSASVVMTQPVTSVASAAVTSTLDCFGNTNGQVTASNTGGTTPYTYAWNTGGIAALETSLGAGTYSVTVTDQNGCTDSTSVTMTQPVTSIASAAVTSTLDCFGNTNGQVTASNTGGTTPYTYSWNTGGTAALETSLGAGTYSVTVTDQNGCTDSASVTMTQPVTSIASAAVTSTLDCFGNTNGQVTASNTGGTTPYTYSWNTGGTAALETGLGAGTYSVTVTDQNGCTDSASTTVFNPALLIATATQTSAITTFGGSDGQVTGSATGGTSSFTYSWNTGGTAALETGLVAGTYSITITDQNGCTDSSSAIVSQPPAFSASAVLDSNVSCNGIANGGVTASPIGGGSPYTYSWSNSATTASITGIVAGTYSVTITENGGLTATSSITVTQPAILVAANIVDSNITCNSFANGGATASATGGTAPYSYSWSNSATTASITGVMAGTYSTTITDANGCTSTSAATITEPAALVAASVVDSNTTCNGFANGGATASASGGTAPYTYAWSNSATTASITGVIAGTYSTTITDANGCTSTSAATITEPSALVAASAVDSNISCNSFSDGGATASATGGTTPYTYAWSNSATTASITGVIAGTYSVTIMDANGCSSTSSATVVEPTILLAASVVDSNITCNGFADGGASASATGGTAPYTYAWSNSATTASITGVMAGTYSVTIMDANGCSSTTASTVTEPTILVAASVVDSNTTCNGFANGGATASATGGTMPYTYSWSNSATTASITGVLAGTYSVTIMDANGCSSISSSTVTQPAILAITTVVDSNITCNGFANGGATASASNGTAPYTYAWSNSATTASITGVTAGTYSVTIMDANGCTSASSVTVVEPVTLLAASIVDSNITCNGSADGGATASATGGTSPYTYTWSNSATTASITGVVAGTYSVTIMDANGCSSTSASTVTEPTILVAASVVDSNATCNGFANGGATASATGGTSPYTYSWSNSATTASITGVVAGTYSTTITDANGCTDSTSITITEPLTLVASTILDSNDTGGGTGGATGTATGGSTPYTYSWSNAATTASITGVSAGTYSTTITDASGCTDSASVIIAAGPSLSVTNDSNVTCNSLANGGATAVASSGTLPYTYSWSNSATTASITGVIAGTYTVTLTDANNITAIDSVTITQPAALVAATVVDSNTTCNGYADGGATASATGGTSPYTYSWSNSATTASITGIMAGTYTTTITDANGCTSINSSTVTEPVVLANTISLDSNDLGNGGGATASATGGNTPYIYSWSNAATTASITGLSAGTYTVTVTDANACSGSAPQSITITAGPVITMVLDSNVQCNGYSNGGITASVIGGTTPYTYAWNNSATTASLTGLIAGTYTVTVTDNNSLSSTGSITVTEPSVPTTVTTVDTNVSCFGGSNGVATAGISQINTIYFEGFENYSGASTYSANTALLGLSGASFETSTTQGRVRIPAGANYVRTGNFSVTLDAAVITSPDPVNYLIKTWDLSAYTTSPLNIDFWMMDHGDESDANDRVWIRGSNTDSWIEVYNLVSPNLSNGVWTNISIPRIDTIITNASQTLTSTFEVRFGQQDNFPSNSITSSDGFTFDDISITTNTVSQNTYLWSNNDTTASVTGLIAGKYMVTVTNGAGCSAVDSVTISEPTLLTTSTVVDSNATCNGLTDGGGTASATGGTAPYAYAWSTSATTSTATGLTNAKHFVTVTDAQGCAAIDSITIIVEDTVRPMVITQNINSYLDNTGNATITTTAVDNGSNDACGIQSMQLDIATFNCSNIGANTVYLIVTDVNGNSDSATATITVLDTLNPVVAVQNYTTYLDANGTTTIDSTHVDNGSTDNCSIQSIALSATNFTCANVGANAVLVTVTDVNGNSDTATATVTVSDTISPTVNTQNITVYLDATGSASITTSDIDNSSTDNCSIQSLSLDSTQFDCSETGYNTVTLSITDVNGNTSSNTATVTVLDTISPTVITQSHTAYLNPSGFALITTSDIDNGSSDNCSIQSLTLSQVIFNCADTGLNTVALQVTDLNGNISSANAAVTIMDTLMPTVNTQNTTVYLDAAGQASIVVTDIDNGSTDNCSVQNMVLDITSFDCSNVGPNTVILTVTDVNGNANTATAQVTVIDNIAPIMATQDITVYLDATGMAVITDTDIDNGSTDNCAIQSYSVDISSFNCNDLGTNTVILAATDVNGNVNSASAIVTVLDTITPVITCPAAFSDCGPEITIPDVITTDNCVTTLTLLSGIESNQTFPVGLTTNTYMVEDITGNSATCYVDITRYPQPVVTVREDTTVFYEQSVTLYSTSEFVVEWDWTPRMFLDDASSNQPICTPQHTSNYTLVGKSADGCYSDPKTVAITMNEAGAVLVPNTFSPNGDGYNDYFEIAGISFHPDMRITIFNRNGEILFQETGYENNWDGTANGKLLPVATYYFILDQGNGKDPIKGDITIIK
jgi:gliding motility-associated-like protein